MRLWTCFFLFSFALISRAEVGAKLPAADTDCPQINYKPMASAKDTLKEEGDLRFPFMVKAKNSVKGQKTASGCVQPDPNAPKQYAILCAHGLSDSSYYMRSVARCALPKSGQSSNVEFRSVPLAGHASPKDLMGEGISKVSHKDWIKDMKCAIQQARCEGKIPILCGLSTGGASAIYNALGMSQDQLGGMILLSPAVDLSPVQKGAGQRLGFSNDLSSYGPIRIAKVPGSAIQELDTLTKLIQKSQGRISVPTFVSHSTNDTTVYHDNAIRELEKKLTGPVSFYQQGNGKAQSVILGRTITQNYKPNSSNWTTFPTSSDKVVRHSAVLSTQEKYGLKEKGNNLEHNSEMDEGGKVCEGIRSYVQRQTSPYAANTGGAPAGVSNVDQSN